MWKLEMGSSKDTIETAYPGDGADGCNGDGGCNDDDDGDGGDDYDNAQTAVMPIKIPNVKSTPLNVTINFHPHNFVFVPQSSDYQTLRNLLLLLISG
jgi:hypothetical protein